MFDWRENFLVEFLFSLKVRNCVVLLFFVDREFMIVLSFVFFNMLVWVSLMEIGVLLMFNIIMEKFLVICVKKKERGKNYLYF